jgi:hypothetical protein
MLVGGQGRVNRAFAADGQIADELRASGRDARTLDPCGAGDTDGGPHGAEEDIGQVAVMPGRPSARSRPWTGRAHRGLGWRFAINRCRGLSAAAD